MNNNSLTLWQRLGLKITLYAIPTYVLPRACFQYLFHYLSNSRCPSQADFIRNRVIRWLSSNLDFQQFRLATAETEDIHDALNKYPVLLQMGAEVFEVENSEFKAFWVPEIPGADYIVFYIHGGGFTSGSSTESAKYLLQLATQLQERGLSCSVLSVEYDLSPEVQYPSALRQISAAYAYACTNGKSVILVGDSAGGHLCLSLLKHLQSPHPKIKALQNPTLPSLLILVSPWVDLNNTSSSVLRNASFDCLDKKTLDSWATQYLGNLKLIDEYTDPLRCRSHWQDVLPESTLMIAGEFECFVSDILELAKNIKVDQYSGLDVHIEPLKGHAWPCVDFAFGITRDGEEMTGESLEVASATKGLQLQVDWIIERLAIRHT